MHDKGITPSNSDPFTKASCSIGAWYDLVFGQGEESPNNQKKIK